MLEVFTKFICFIIMYTTGYLVIKRIVGNSPKLSKWTYLYILLLAVVSIFLHTVQYTSIYTIIIFLLNIVVYKRIFKITLAQSTIASGIFMAVLITSDMMITTLLRVFFTQDQIRSNNVIFIISNLLIGTLSVLLLKIKIIYKILYKFYSNFSNKKVLTDIIFLMLLVIGLTQLAYNYATAPGLDENYIVNIIIVIIFTILTLLFLQNKNNYKTLSDEYDSLFSYVQNFEEWIEKEQLNRHEYKNQLAVLRTLAKEKKVKTKIDEILEDNINIKDEVVNKLKDLPKGGLKGLMYYKAAIAQKQKIKLAVDVSLKNNTILKKLSENQVRIICKLIGIYFDNAIEAAIETKKKYVILEIYELSDKVNIVFSNTFKTSNDIKKRNEKGTTTKGEGHGNGLYFANNILSKNKWLDSKQEIIDGYYIQTLSIKKLDIK